MTDATTTTPAPPTTRRPPPRRRLLLLAAVATPAIAAAIWALSTSFAPDLHSSNNIARPSDEVVALDGGLRQLHGHLNHVVWNEGTYDGVAFAATVDATLARTEDERVATYLEDALELADDGDHYRAHTFIERAERRMADLVG